MPIVTKEHLEARKKQIIEAAVECFIEKGFKKTSMRDIFRAANLSSGAVYNYFSSKDKIVEAIAQVSQKQNLEIINSAAKDENPLMGAAKVFFAMVKDPDCIRHLGMTLELFVESKNNNQIEKSLRKNIKASIDKLTEFVKSEQEKRNINNELDAESVAQALMMLFMGLQTFLFINMKVDINELSSVFEAILNGRFSHWNKRDRIKKKE